MNLIDGIHSGFSKAKLLLVLLLLLINSLRLSMKHNPTKPVNQTESKKT